MYVSQYSHRSVYQVLYVWLNLYNTVCLSRRPWCEPQGFNAGFSFMKPCSSPVSASWNPVAHQFQYHETHGRTSLMILIRASWSALSRSLRRWRWRRNWQYGSRLEPGSIVQIVVTIRIPYVAHGHEQDARRWVWNVDALAGYLYRDRLDVHKIP